jgi:hypothetical protein
MKKFLLALALMMPLASFSQEEDSSKSTKTTFEKFTSKIGTIVKFKDYKLEDVTGKLGSGLMATTYVVHGEVRQVFVGNESSLFLRLTYQGYQHPERVAFIAYEDVLEIDKALTELISQSLTDSTGDAYYLENKFKTKDDFHIGYYIQKSVSKKGEESNELRWYVDLDNRYNYSTAFFPSPDGLKAFFTSAIQKMNEIKSK